MSTSSSPFRRPAPAKVNLGLHVLRRRSDGFHDVETILLPIGWADEVLVTSSDAFRFSCSDPSLPTDERNLCVRAARALAEYAGIAPHGALHLEKRVPHGAGLGGGSSDAAHTLRLLAEHWRLDVPAVDLHALAAELGSDVPFFLHDGPALATGRGEVLEPLDYALPYALTVVMPPVTVGTAEAYGLVRPDDRDRPDLTAVVRSNDLERWRAELTNDFEAPILERHPEIAEVKRLLEEGGAEYAALSGSGAAFFGVFEREADALEAAAEAERRGLGVWTSA